MVNEQSYTATLRDNVITDFQCRFRGHSQSALFNVSQFARRNSQDLVRVYITHEEMVNTNIIVGPDYLGNITADIIMDQIADVIHSNNFIPANGGLIINIAAICNIKGLRHKVISNVWKHMHQKRCILMVENDDELCLPHCIALAIAHAEHNADSNNRDLCRNYHSMHKKDRRYVKLREMSSLQKCTALKYQSMASIQMYSPGLLEHIHLYEKALGVGITFQPREVIRGYTSLIPKIPCRLSSTTYTAISMTGVIMQSLYTLMHYWEKVISVLSVMWPLTTAQVIDVECGVIYVDEMVTSWRMHLLQLYVIHAMLLAIPLNAWRHTRPKEADRAHPCVTACYSVPTVASSCAITKKRGGG